MTKPVASRQGQSVQPRPVHRSVQGPGPVERRCCCYCNLLLHTGRPAGSVSLCAPDPVTHN